MFFGDTFREHRWEWETSAKVQSLKLITQTLMCRWQLGSQTDRGETHFLSRTPIGRPQPSNFFTHPKHRKKKPMYFSYKLLAIPLSILVEYIINNGRNRIKNKNFNT